MTLFVAQSEINDTHLYKKMKLDNIRSWMKCEN